MPCTSASSCHRASSRMCLLHRFCTIRALVAERPRGVDKRTMQTIDNKITIVSCKIAHASFMMCAQYKQTKSTSFDELGRPRLLTGRNLLHVNVVIIAFKAISRRRCGRKFLSRFGSAESKARIHCIVQVLSRHFKIGLRYNANVAVSASRKSS